MQENCSERLVGWRDAVPPPKSISPEAQASLSAPQAAALDFPEAHDEEGWRQHIAEMDASMAPLWDVLPGDLSIKLERHRVAGVSVVSAKHLNPLGGKQRVYLDFHGGALIYLGGELVDYWARSIATRTGANVISVDYRMPPKHPYPAGLDDAVEVYRSMVASYGAENIIVGGSSAGGNIAAALALRARDEDVQLPAGLVLLSPEADLTESGDSFQTLLGLDRLYSLRRINELYAAGVPLDDPYISPLFGDFSKGFPPTFLQSGTRDLFLSNAVRMHRALRRENIPAQLHIWEAMPHGWFLGAPEDREVDTEIRSFMASIWH